ncbi:MAG: metal-dependent transcriptional regulator [Promethearchaeota archaeon]
MSCHEDSFGLRLIEEEIFEVLFQLCSERSKNERVKMKEILEGIDGLSKTQLTNIIQRKLAVGKIDEETGLVVRPILVDYLPYNGILLTDEGYATAKAMQRKHRLAEVLLDKILGLEWEIIHDEACCLEHGMTESIAEAIFAKLGSSLLTPYGFPIPSNSPEREVIHFNDISLIDAPLNKTLILKRVKPSHDELLQELKKIGIKGLSTRFSKKQQEEESLILSVNNRESELSIKFGKRVYVSVEEEKGF